MKRFLATTTILALSAGFASAEVTLSGDARMGIIGGDGVETGFTSRARVKFSMSGETDGGLTFGASFRADNAKAISDTDTTTTCVVVADGPDFGTEPDLACTSTTTTTTTGGANVGTAGEVYMSTGGFKLSMGDVDGAGAAAVGQVSGVGLTGLGDLNEIAYISSGGVDHDGGGPLNFGSTDDPSALVEYAAGSLTAYASVTNPSGTANAYAIGAKFSSGDYTFAAAYESLDLASSETISQIVLGASATFGAITAKLVYGRVESNGSSGTFDQMSASLDYSADALTVTAFYTDSVDLAPSPLGGEEAYGIGASYDLGGGASVVGGYVQNKTADDSAFDLGLSFSF